MKTQISVLFITLLLMGCGKGKTDLSHDEGQMSPEQEQQVAASAKKFFMDYTRLHENMRFDDACVCIDSNAILVVNHETTSYDEIKKMYEDFENKVQSLKLPVKKLQVRVIGPNEAVVNAKYSFNARLKDGKEQNVEGTQTSILKRINGEWKFMANHETVDNYPLRFGDAIPLTSRTGAATIEQRFTNCIGQAYGMILGNIAMGKESGISVEDQARKMGEIFANTWNKEAGFDGLVRGVIYNIQALSTRPEILERSRDHLVVRMYKDYKPNLKTSGISDEEMLKWFEIVNGTIVRELGGTLKIEDEGNYIVMRVDRTSQT